MPGGVAESLREGVYETTLSTGAMDLTLLELLLKEDMPNVRGYADARIRFSGPIDTPAFEGTIKIPSFIVDRWGPVELASDFRYEYGALLAQVRMADAEGELIEGEGSLLVNLVHLAQQPSEAVEALATSPWRVSVRMPPRHSGPEAISIPASIGSRTPRRAYAEAKPTRVRRSERNWKTGSPS